MRKIKLSARQIKKLQTTKDGAFLHKRLMGLKERMGKFWRKSEEKITTKAGA